VLVLTLLVLVPASVSVYVNVGNPHETAAAIGHTSAA
jgi:hypothetical protein